jgi:hypothetical protein
LLQEHGIFTDDFFKVQSTAVAQLLTELVVKDMLNVSGSSIVQFSFNRFSAFRTFAVHTPNQPQEGCGAAEQRADNQYQPTRVHLAFNLMAAALHNFAAFSVYFSLYS